MRMLAHSGDRVSILKIRRDDNISRSAECFSIAAQGETVVRYYRLEGGKSAVRQGVAEPPVGGDEGPAIGSLPGALLRQAWVR